MRNNSTWAPLALSPTNWSREAWNPLFTLLTLVGAIVLLAVCQLGYFMWAYDHHLIDLNHIVDMPGAQQLIIQLVTWAPITALLLYLSPKLAKTSLTGLGFRAPTARELGIAIGGAFVMAVVVNGTGTLMSAILHRQDTEQAVLLLGAMKTPFLRTAFILLACAFAPFYEELAFRVFLFNALTRYSSIPAAAIVSGVLFGLLHISSWGLEVLTVGFPLMLGGIILAYVYATTKCFWANVITHALFNSISVVSIFVFHAS